MPDATEADFDLGRSALLEITSAESIGAPAGSIDEGEGVTTVYFENNLAGYPGWRWTVSIAHVEGEEPSALETELTPGDTALLSPDWVPWVDRLAEYRATQEALGLAAELEGEHDDDEDDDDDDLGGDLLHGGDLDGVDIDDSDEPDDNELDDHIEDDEELSGADELDVPPVRVQDSDEAEGETADAGPQPPAETGGEEWSEQGEEHDKSY